jgi:predicted NBD/HSP70 family sugar kinase
MIAIGIDIGGTSTRVGAVGVRDEEQTVVASRRTATLDHHGALDLLDWLARAVDEVAAEVAMLVGGLSQVEGPPPARITGVGLAVPGILDRECRKVVRALNVPFIEGLKLGEDLSKRIDCPVRLVTDSDAATWAEYVACATTDDALRFAHLRFGTGVGCGLVIGGKLQTMERNRAGHLDVLVVDEGSNAATCPCGRRGCLETIASWKALDERSKQAGYANGADDLPRAYGNDDDSACEIVQRAAGAVVLAIANIVRRYDVELTCVGGGTVDYLPCLFNEVQHRLESASSDLPAAVIMAARRGDDAGVIGAALLACREGGMTE